MGKHAECCEEHCVHTNLVNKVLKDLPDEDALYDLAELFKVFGDSTRQCGICIRSQCIGAVT